MRAWLKSVGYLMVFLLCVGSVSAATSVMLLEQGVYAEESVGDLERAIEIYRTIVEDDQAKRAHSAEALFRMGRCYGDLGNKTDATVVLKQLIAQFPEQTALVDHAKALVKELHPQVLFPEFKKNRVIYKLNLGLVSDEMIVDEQVHSINRIDALGLIWEIDPAVSNQVKRFEVRLVPLEQTNVEPVVLKRDHPGHKRFCYVDDLYRPVFGSCRLQLRGYGDEGEDPVVQAAALLKLGEPRYTEFHVTDISPSQEVRFTTANYGMNLGMEAMEQWPLRCADYFSIESVKDPQGHALDYSITSADGRHKLDVVLREPVQPYKVYGIILQGRGERLVNKVKGTEHEYRYVYEFKQGGVYPVRRVEIFYLPEGAEVLETVPVDMPQRVRNERVELYWDGLVPSGNNQRIEIRYRLNAEGSEPKLELIPAPWKAGEVMRYRLMIKMGAEIGHQIWTVDEVEKGGMACWNIEQRLLIPLQNMTMASKVIAEQESFAPVNAWTRNILGFSKAEYGRDRIRLQSGYGTNNVRDIEVDKTYFDNEQAIYLIRRMPLKEGYRATFPLMSISAAVTSMECRVQVVARKEIAVPAGTFDCWRVDLQVYSGSVKMVEQEFWFSVDDHVLAKVDAGMMELELVEAGNVADEVRTIELARHSITLAMPEGWFAFEVPPNETGTEILRFLPPEMKVSGILSKTLRLPTNKAIREIAEKDMEVLRGYFEDYVVRSDSLVEKEINGYPAFIYVADYRVGKGNKVEYRAYYVVDSQVFWFVFRTNSRRFDRERTELDTLIDGIKFNGTSKDG